MTARTSLAQLLAARRGRRHPFILPPLSITMILEWADAHHARTGQWPSCGSGAVRGARHEKWIGIDNALRYGRRALPGGSSLALLLADWRQRPYQGPGAPITEPQIIRWAKAHHRRTGQWPRKTSGSVFESPSDTWQNINYALRKGHRGLPGGTSLLMLLAERCGMRHRKLPPPLSLTTILAWADRHETRTGDWPTMKDGPVHEAPDETWLAIDHALRRGTRGLPGHSSLALLLMERRGRPHQFQQPPLTIEQILQWADAHRARTGRWPHNGSGPVVGPDHEHWGYIDGALRQGRRGLPGGSSLSHVLVQHRGKFDRAHPPRLTVSQVLQWADAHRARTGTWPNHLSGVIPEAQGQTWNGIYHVLQRGRRGLPKGSSIALLLAKHRPYRHRFHPPRLTYKKVLDWADSHYQRTGEWPSRSSGPIPELPGETWAKVAAAMQHGARGLRPRYGLVRLLTDKRGSVYRRRGLPLKPSQILEWAAHHHELTGEIPHCLSGPVRGVSGESWAAIDASLRSGARGLKGSQSLAELLIRHYVPPYPGCGAPLSIPSIIDWAEAFRHRVGRWPTARSAFTDPSRTERWSVIDDCLRAGLRGLPGGSSLARLLREHRQRQKSRS